MCKRKKKKDTNIFNISVRWKTLIGFNGLCNYITVTLIPPFVKTESK